MGQIGATFEGIYHFCNSYCKALQEAFIEPHSTCLTVKDTLFVRGKSLLGVSLSGIKVCQE